MTDSSDPAAVASPIGKSVSANIFEVMYTPGMRTRAMAMMLCTNESEDLPHAQKYPLKQKCMPAKRQSHI